MRVHVPQSNEQSTRRGWTMWAIETRRERKSIVAEKKENKKEKPTSMSLIDFNDHFSQLPTT